MIIAGTKLTINDKPEEKAIKPQINNIERRAGTSKFRVLFSMIENSDFYRKNTVRFRTTNVQIRTFFPKKTCTKTN
jgi:hypothetical protein